MFVRLFTIVAMFLWSGSLATGTSFDEASAQWSVMDLMFITIIVLLVSNCYLLARMSTARSGTSSPQSPQSTRDVKKTGGVKKQGTLDAAGDRIPEGEIFFAQTSRRWHRSPNCCHLRAASTKISSLNPCQTCAGSLTGWSQVRWTINVFGAHHCGCVIMCDWCVSVHWLVRLQEEKASRHCSVLPYHVTVESASIKINQTYSTILDISKGIQHGQLLEISGNDMEIYGIMPRIWNRLYTLWDHYHSLSIEWRWMEQYGEHMVKHGKTRW